MPSARRPAGRLRRRAVLYPVLLGVAGLALSAAAVIATSPARTPGAEPAPPVASAPSTPSQPSQSSSGSSGSSGLPVEPPSASSELVTRSVLNAPVTEPSGPFADFYAPALPLEEAASPDKVFAHYFPPYPLSIDNELPRSDYYTRHYLTVAGEDGKHRAYGGLLRDRPLGRAPLAGDWEVTDMRTEIRQAKAVGIDGFTLDVLALQGRTWVNALTLMEAADLEDFEVIPMLDASSIGSTPEPAAAAFAELLAHPSAHVVDGEHVLASFLAEAKTVAWWTELIDRLETEHLVPIKFIAMFNNPSDTNLQAFAPFSYGLGAWGYRNAAGAEESPDLAARAQALGVKWMHTVAVQDARPRSGVYAEAGNTETLRATWARAIEDGADLVQIATWNDYSESTSIAPSMAHGWAFLELMGYYGEWFTRGAPPPITRDQVVLTHRTHAWDAEPSSGIGGMAPTLGGSSVAPRDTVEAWVALTAPAWVTVTSGPHTTTVQRPAGVSTVLVPLGPGRPTAQVVRGAEVVASVESPYPVVDQPFVQDLQYVAAGS